MPRKEKKYHFIYKTTNLLSGKYYIGMHSTDNLEDGYMGSGKRLRYSINKYGKESHKREILEFLDSREELKKKEREIVSLNEIAKKECMNIMLGGQGGFVSEEVQKKRSIAANKALNEKMKTDKEFYDIFRKKISKGVKETYKNGREGKNYFSWKGKSHSEETKKKISESNKGMGIGEENSQYGTCWVNKNGVNKRIRKEELEEYLSQDWKVGGLSVITEELLIKMKESYDNGFSYKKLSNKFGIPKSTIVDSFKRRLKTGS